MENLIDRIVKLNDKLETLLKRYEDVPVSILLQNMNISFRAKNSRSLLTKKILENANVDFINDLVTNNDITIKNIKLDKYGRLKEAVSFPAFKYCELVEENWENSSLYKCFNNKIFVFVVFQSKGKEDYFKRIVFWSMSEDVLNIEVRKVWDSMRECLSQGNVVKYIDEQGRYHSYFPSSTENPYVHVRPHARDRNDTNRLPVQDKVTGLIEYPKHSFWLNRSYVYRIITKEDMLNAI